MWLIIYFILGTIETLGLFLYNLHIESSLQERIWLTFSLERLILLAFILIVLVFLLCITLRAVSRKVNGKDFFKKVTGNQRVLWLIIFASILISAVVFYLFIQPQGWFGDYFAVFLTLRPLLFWLLVISLQTFFFTLIWYCVHFIPRTQNDLSSLEISEIVAVLGVFVLSMAMKYLFVLPNGFGMLKDVGETKYLYMLQYFYEGIFLRSATEFTTHYPPLYPLSLMFTFYLRDYAFEGIMALNACYASSLVFPIYLISRRFYDQKTSLIVVILISLIPFQFQLPVRLLSENLYFPLLMWALYLILVAPRDGKYRLAWDCLTGFSLGLLYLTRYISLSLIPSLLLVWWLKPYKGAEQIYRLYPKKVLNLLIVVLVAVFTFSPWIAVGLKNGLPLSQMLGFGIASNTNPEQLTLLNLGKWILFYVGYFILLAAPVLNLLLVSLRTAGLKNLKSEKNRWLILVAALVIAFGMAVVRHSWRADYNLELPKRLMGRYVIYFVPLFIASAFTAFKSFNKDNYRNIPDFILRNELLPLMLVILSYLLVIEGRFFPVNTAFIHPLISIDGYYIQLLGRYFFVLIILLYTIGNVFLWAGRKELMGVVAIGLAVYYLLGEPAYLNLLKTEQTSQQIGKHVMDLMIATNHNADEDLSYRIFLPDSMTKDQMDDVGWTIFIRHPLSEWQVNHYSVEELSESSETVDIVVLSQEDDTAALGESYELVDINSEQYAFKLIAP